MVPRKDSLAIKIDLNKISINGVEFCKDVPLEAYRSVLGEPTRSVPIGPPAPYGHRNPVAHYFDNDGIVLGEDHATSLIRRFTILLDPLTSLFPTKYPYTHELDVCGVPVASGIKFRQFAASCEQQFRLHLGHAWYVDGNSVSINLEVVSASRKRGTKKTIISEVNIGFRNAHRAESSV